MDQEVQKKKKKQKKKKCVKGNKSDKLKKYQVENIQESPKKHRLVRK
jgi:hypothetical protein